MKKLLEKIKNKFKNITKHDIVLFLIPILTGSFFLYVYAPGIYNFDTFTQIIQINNMEFTTGNPFISTLYIMFFVKFLNCKLLLPIFQLLWFSFMWSNLLKYNRRNNNNKKILILQYIITILLSINPLIMLVVITNSKDSLFMLIFFTICIIIQRIIDQNYNCPNKLYIALAMFLAIFISIRYNGLYAGYLFAFFLIIMMLFKLKGKLKLKTLIFGFSLILSIFLLKSTSLFFNVTDSNVTSYEMGKCKALQLNGYLLRNNILTDKEKSILSKYVDLKSLNENAYNTTFLDPVLTTKVTEYMNDHESEYIKESIKIALNHFKSSLKFYFLSSEMVWYPILPDTTYASYVWLDIAIPNRVEGYYYYNENTKLFKTVDKILRDSNSNNLSIVTLYSPAVYFYLSLVFMIILIIKHHKKYFMMLLLNIINIIIISLSTPVPATRLLYNNYIITFILAVLTLSVVLKKTDKADY